MGIAVDIISLLTERNDHELLLAYIFRQKEQLSVPKPRQQDSCVREAFGRSAKA